MLTQQPTGNAAESATAQPAQQPRPLDELIAYFEGDYVPLRDAKVSIMTHAFMYGTATFEGIRGYWNAEHGELYVLFLREHVERIRNSAKMLLMEDLPSVEELAAIVLETVRRNGFREDVYIRPSFYKSTKAIGVRLHHLDHELYVIATPFGNYIDIEKGVRVMTSSWRRNADEALPARGKIVGGYVNMAFQKSEAELNGFDEALVLTPDGHASEALGRQPVRRPRRRAADAAGVGRHPRGRHPQGDPRRSRGTPASPIEIRSIDRSELYVCDEVFLCGTGVQMSPVIEVDHRRSAAARSARSRGCSASATSPRCAGTCPSTGTGSRPSRAERAERRSGRSADRVDLEVRRVLAQGHDDVDVDLRVGRRLDRRLVQLLEVRDRLGQLGLGAVVDRDHRPGCRCGNRLLGADASRP